MGQQFAVRAKRAAVFVRRNEFAAVVQKIRHTTRMCRQLLRPTSVGSSSPRCRTDTNSPGHAFFPSVREACAASSVQMVIMDMDSVSAKMAGAEQLIVSR